MAVPTKEAYFEIWKKENPILVTYNDGASVGKANYGTFTSGISLASPGFRDWQLPGKHPSLKTNQDKFETDYKIFAIVVIQNLLVGYLKIQTSGKAG